MAKGLKKSRRRSKPRKASKSRRRSKPRKVSNMTEPQGGDRGGKGKGDKGDDVADGGRGGGRGGGKGHGGRGKGKGGKGGKGRGGGECTTIEFHFAAWYRGGWRSNYVPENCPGTEILVLILNEIGREFRRQVYRIPIREPDPGRDRGERIKEFFSVPGYAPLWFNPDFALSSNGEFLEINNEGRVRVLREMVLPLLSNDGIKKYEKHYHFHPAAQGGLRNCVTLTIRFEVQPRPRMAPSRLGW